MAADISPDDLFQLENPFRKKHVMVMAPNEASFRLIERVLLRMPRLELSHVQNRIEALAHIFMFKPALVIVFCETNQETQAFIQLIRNNPSFKRLPVFAVYTEPLTFWQKLKQGLNIAEKFETPLATERLYATVEGVIESN